MIETNIIMSKTLPFLHADWLRNRKNCGQCVARTFCKAAVERYRKTQPLHTILCAFEVPAAVLCLCAGAKVCAHPIKISKDSDQAGKTTMTLLNTARWEHMLWKNGGYQSKEHSRKVHGRYHRLYHTIS